MLMRLTYAVRALRHDMPWRTLGVFWLLVLVATAALAASDASVAIASLVLGSAGAVLGAILSSFRQVPVPSGASPPGSRVREAFSRGKGRPAAYAALEPVLMHGRFDPEAYVRQRLGPEDAQAPLAALKEIRRIANHALRLAERTRSPSPIWRTAQFVASTAALVVDTSDDPTLVGWLDQFAIELHELLLALPRGDDSNEHVLDALADEIAAEAERLRGISARVES